MKTIYQQPEIKIVNIRAASTLLTSSNQGVSTEDFNGEKGTILSRRNGGSFFDDDDDDY